MPDVLTGFSDDQSHKPELAIRISVPEEFLGASIGEINSRRGYVRGIEVESGTYVILANLPIAEYGALAHELAFATRQRAKLELDTSGSQTKD
jgi:elongation factor G